MTAGVFSMYPEGIVFDKNDNFYISDHKNHRIIQFNEFGIPLSLFGNMGFNDGQFKFPKDVAISKDGYLFITDSQGDRIQKFSTNISALSANFSKTSVAASARKSSARLFLFRQ